MTQKKNNLSQNKQKQRKQPFSPFLARLASAFRVNSGEPSDAERTVGGLLPALIHSLSCGNSSHAVFIEMTDAVGSGGTGGRRQPYFPASTLSGSLISRSVHRHEKEISCVKQVNLSTLSVSTTVALSNFIGFLLMRHHHSKVKA